LIASLILSGNFEQIADILPSIVQQEKSTYSDVYTQFVEALYESFDFPLALKLAKDLGRAASEDLLLKNHAQEIQAQATVLVFQVKSKLYKQVNLKELAVESGISNEEEVRTRIEESMKREGLAVEYEETTKTLRVIGHSKDQKAKIFNKTTDLVKRTNTLYQHYQ
jgi:hypothetical protein